MTDIWEAQREVMQRSGQHLPTKPVLTLFFFSYLAMMMEEFAETLSAVDEATHESMVMSVAGLPVGSLVRKLSDTTLPLAGEMLQMSRRIRQEVAQVDEAQRREELVVPVRQMAQVLDGLTDLAVVVAGGGLSAGLPAAAAYDEVVGSNNSKADPKTGRIEIDASGKWIKGPNYAPPNLEGILEEIENPGGLPLNSTD